MSRPLVFLDTETDGVHPGRKFWEIAMIRRAEGEQREYHAFLPLDLKTADPVGLDIGGFWDRHPIGRKLSGKVPTPSDVAPLTSTHEVAKTVMQWTFGATIVGAVPWFDTEILGRLLRAEGYLPSWHHRLRCVETLTAGRLCRDVGGLSDCMTALALPRSSSGAHTALGDAYDAMTIWDLVMQS